MAQGLLTGNIRVKNIKWLFGAAITLSLDQFLDHLVAESWLGSYYGFIARPCESNDNLWEILCPEVVHKTQVTTTWLTNFVANLPEGTKIDIGGFKNV